MPEAEDKKATKGGAKTGGAKKAAKPRGGAGPRADTPAAAPLNVEGYTPRLKKHYEEVVRPKLIEEFGYANPMQVPTIEKIVLNMGVGESTADSKKASVA